MKRELSSKATFFVKIITPVICLLFAAINISVAFFSTPEKPLPLTFKLFLLVFGFILAAILYFTVMKFMKVSVDDGFLYVNNFFKEINIPLSNVADVTEIVWVRGHPVTIHLKKPSEFGRKITFMPKSNGFRFFQPHPVVGELKELARL